MMKTNTTFQRSTIGIFVTVLLAAGLFSGCGRSDQGQEVKQQDSDRTFEVIVVDSCEYLYRVSGHRGFMAHKGNCRFCAARMASTANNPIE